MSMDAYDIPEACARIAEFMEILTNWYIRRNRRRFWKSESDTDKCQAYDTLYTTLVTVAKMTAPLIPFTSEAVYRNLTGERSVHLADWPEPSSLVMDRGVLGRMDVVRRACSLGHAVRNQSRIRVRQPLPEVAFAGNDSVYLKSYKATLMDEMNVKDVKFLDDVGLMGHEEIVLDKKTLGPRLGNKMKDILGATASGNVEIRDDGTLFAAGEVIQPSEFKRRILAEEGHAAASDGGLFVNLDLHITRELELEGLARDVIRVVQNARKEADLVPDERIRLGLTAEGDLREAIDAHYNLICNEVLAEELSFNRLDDPVYTETADVQGMALGIAVGRM
jgi:isoleucyl-tRNA synthetase